MKPASGARIGLVALGVYVALKAMPSLTFFRDSLERMFQVGGFPEAWGFTVALLLQHLLPLGLAYVLIRHAHRLVGWVARETPLDDPPYWEAALYRTAALWTGFVIAINSVVNLLLVVGRELIPAATDMGILSSRQTPGYVAATWQVLWLGAGVWLLWVAPRIVLGMSVGPTARPIVADQPRIGSARLAVRLTGLVLAAYAVYHAVQPLFAAVFYLATPMFAGTSSEFQVPILPMLWGQVLVLGLLARRYVRKGCPLRTLARYGRVPSIPAWERAGQRCVATFLAIGTFTSALSGMTGGLTWLADSAHEFVGSAYATGMMIVMLIVAACMLAFCIYLFLGAPHFVRWQLNRFARLQRPAKLPESKSMS